MGVRPQYIVLSDDLNAVSPVADVHEMMGSEVHLHVTAEGKDVVTIVPTMRLKGDYRQQFNEGAQVHFSLGGNVFHLFDADGNNPEIK